MTSPNPSGVTVIPPGYNDPHNYGPAPLAGSDAWLPGDNLMMGAAGDLDAYLVTNVATVAGTLYLAKIPVRFPVASCGHVVWGVQTAGTGASTTTFTGLYDPTGKLIVGSADVSASLIVGLGSCPLSSAVPLLGLPFVWAAIITNFATTQPSLYRSGGAGTIAASNGLLGASLMRFAVNGTGLSALPTSINPASNTSAGAFPYWAGIAA